MPNPNLVEHITSLNSAREPERLRLKYAAMRANPFSFLRGTCHLFYADLATDFLLTDAPVVWCCGDLQFENFGSYEGDNRLSYFDLNDFDDAALAPCTFDLLRFLTSILVGIETLKINLPEGMALCQRFLEAYSHQLTEGKARWVERTTARGMIKDLLRNLDQRDRKAFLDKRVERHKRRRLLRTGGKKALPASDTEREAIIEFMETFAATQPEPGFFQVMDVARRIAGTGSLGVERYVILVEGNGSPNENYLLDLKQSRPSALSSALQFPQPAWTSDAERIVCIQKRMQAISPAFLQFVTINSNAYVLKELQPTDDRVSLDQWHGRFRRLENAVATMGEVVAWAQLRSSGRQGSAIADTLIEFGSDEKWQSNLIDLAAANAQRIHAQWEEYAEAYDHGAFSLS